MEETMNGSDCIISVKVSRETFRKALKFLDWGYSLNPKWLSRFDFSYKKMGSALTLHNVSVEIEIYNSAFKPDITNLGERGIKETKEQFEERKKYQKEELPKKYKKEFMEFKEILGIP